MDAMTIGELPSQHFRPRIYGVGAWTDNLHFAYDVVAALRPKLLVELGADRGESYFSFCQSIERTTLAPLLRGRHMAGRPTGRRLR
jgi:hypothetical protein